MVFINLMCPCRAQEVPWKQTAKRIRRSGILSLEDGFEQELETEWAATDGQSFHRNLNPSCNQANPWSNAGQRQTFFLA